MRVIARFSVLHQKKRQRGCLISVRLSPVEFIAMQKSSAASGQTQSDWMRQWLLDFRASKESLFLARPVPRQAPGYALFLAPTFDSGSHSHEKMLVE
jgi:hypothetical protein